MLGSRNDGPAAPDSDAPRISDYKPMIPDVVDPVIPVASAPMTPGATPGEAAVASPCEMEGVVADEGFPAFCGSVPASEDGVSVPDEESWCLATRRATRFSFSR